MTKEQIDILQKEGYGIFTQFIFVKDMKESNVNKRGCSRVLYDSKHKRFGVETNGLHLEKPEQWRQYLKQLQEVVTLVETLNKAKN